MEQTKYDVAVIGGGPGGYTAALYCARAGMNTILLEQLSPGGQMATTNQIENYPGFEDGIDGFDLAEKMKLSADRAGAVTKFAQVTDVHFSNREKLLFTSEGEVKAKAVIVATGANPKKLGLAEEDGLIGKGVAYCATCDGMLYKDKVVAVIGGGNSAAAEAEAIFLSKICKKVYLIHRRDTLRATKAYIDPLKSADNIEFVWDSIVKKLISENILKALEIQNIKDNSISKIKCDGVFVAIGRVPNTDIFKGKLEVDDYGFIVADESTKTNIDGVFAVGDVRTKALRQIVTAASDGANASHFAEEYLHI